MPDKLERILYLEDDPWISEIVLFALEEFSSLRVVHCDNGKSAIDAVKEFPPQLCLFDVMLPDMTGPETFLRIREMPEYKDIPVIFMTAKAQRHEVEHYLELGALDVIRKPFDPVTLGEQINSIWEKSGAR